MAAGMRIVVGMSGGVDSSVAAARLVDAGHEVIGATILVWMPPGQDRGAAEGCCGLAAAEDARRVCARLGIRHYSINLEEAFYRRIVGNYVSEYLKGRTPNPCVLCNEWIKFDALWDHASALGATHVASGHYARVEPGGDSYRLLRGRDQRKDQSYALYRLSRTQLSRLLLPLGESTKAEVRAEAAHRDLPTAGKPDSQETCFVPDNDYPSLLRQLAPGALRPGPILDEKGRQLGQHEGAACYTIGQRRRINVGSAIPLYVVDIDAATNSIRVAGAGSPHLWSHDVTAGSVRLIEPAPAALLAGEPIRVQARIRYNSPNLWGSLRLEGSGASSTLRMEFDEAVRAAAPGQSLVAFDGDVVIGGGIIEQASGRPLPCTEA